MYSFLSFPASWMCSKYVNDIIPSPVAESAISDVQWSSEEQSTEYEEVPRSPKRVNEDPFDGPPSPKSPRQVPCMGPDLGSLVRRVRNVRIIAYAPETCVWSAQFFQLRTYLSYLYYTGINLNCWLFTLSSAFPSPCCLLLCPLESIKYFIILFNPAFKLNLQFMKKSRINLGAFIGIDFHASFSLKWMLIIETN